jgi:hypothetical protein
VAKLSLCQSGTSLGGCLGVFVSAVWKAVPSLVLSISYIAQATRADQARRAIDSPTRVPTILRRAVSFGLGGKLDVKVIPLHVNTGDMGGDQLPVVE